MKLRWIEREVKVSAYAIHIVKVLQYWVIPQAGCGYWVDVPTEVEEV